MVTGRYESYDIKYLEKKRKPDAVCSEVIIDMYVMYDMIEKHLASQTDTTGHFKLLLVNHSCRSYLQLLSWPVVVAKPSQILRAIMVELDCLLYTGVKFQTVHMESP